MNPSATGPNSPESDPSVVVGVFDRPRHVGDYVGDLGVRQGSWAEARHVAGPGPHRLHDLGRGRVVK